MKALRNIRKFFKEYELSPAYRKHINIQCWISITMFFCCLSGFLAFWWKQIQLSDYLNFSLGIILFLMGGQQFADKFVETSRSDVNSNSFTNTNWKGK